MGLALCIAQLCAMLTFMSEINDQIGAAEAASLLNIDRTGIIRKVAAGELTPVMKLPGRNGAYIFRRSDILALAPTAPSSTVTPPVEDGAFSSERAAS